MTDRTHLHRVYLKRLVDVGALTEGESHDAENLARIVRGEQLEGIVCCRVPLVDGKPKTFADVHWLIFGVNVDGSQPKERKRG